MTPLVGSRLSTARYAAMALMGHAARLEHAGHVIDKVPWYRGGGYVIRPKGWRV